MPEQGKPLESPNHFRDKCYKTKDDKRSSVVTMPDISQDRWEGIFGITEKERLRRLRQFKCSKSEYKEVDFPNVGGWQKEWTYMSCGKRMSKKQLKEYCKKNKKEWLNK